MAFCSKCGATMDNDVVFCPSCGAKPTTAQPQPQSITQSRQTVKLHCPQCRSTNISINTESSVDGALTTSRGALSATKVSNTHRNFWFCKECGTKFRNIQNLEEEIVKTEKSRKLCMVVSIIAAIISAFLIIKSLEEPVLGFLMLSYTIVPVVFAVVCFCFIFVYKGRVKKMKAECDWLKRNCF